MSINSSESPRVLQAWDFMIDFFGLCIGFGGLAVLIIFGLRLTQRDQLVVSLKKELLEVISICLCVGLIVYILLLSRENLESVKEQLSLVLVASFLLIRNIACLSITVIAPILKRREGNIIPYGETWECAKNLELTLNTILPFTYFVSYIKTETDPISKNILGMFTEIKLYEAKADSREYNQEVLDLATNIMNNYINSEDASEKTGLPQEVLARIDKKFKCMGQIADKHLFDSIYGIIMGKLHKLFVSFKKSKVFNQLKEELIRNEVIYERLVFSELI